jgi:proteasome lid subunit RPN8/RPN11
MAVADTRNQFSSWSAEGYAIQIEYSVPVLEEICAAAVDGLYRFRHGGMEIGGALFGRGGGDLIRVVAYRPLECEYAFGPRFVLSERDRAELKELLYAPRREADLRGLEPVGWYHSHTRSKIELSPRDLEIYDSYFPQRWQVALVIRPDSYGPVRAGFFFRERDNRVYSEHSYQEFTVLARRHGLVSNPGFEAALAEERGGPPPRAGTGAGEGAPAAMHARPEAVTPAPSPKAAAPAPRVAGSAEPAPEPLEIPGFARPRPWQGWKWAWVMVAAALVAAAAFGAVQYYIQSAPTQPLSLLATDMGGQLLIEWNRRAKPIREAQGAILEIRDGDQSVTKNLSSEVLREGSVDYTRLSDVVDVRLRVKERNRTVGELIRFIGQPVRRAPDPEDAKLAKQSDELRAEIEALKAQLGDKDEQIRRLRNRVAALRRD